MTHGNNMIVSAEPKPPCMACGSSDWATYTVSSKTAGEPAVILGRYCCDGKGCLNRQANRKGEAA